MTLYQGADKIFFLKGSEFNILRVITQPRSVQVLSEPRQRSHKGFCWCAGRISDHIHTCSECCSSPPRCFSGNSKPEKWHELFSVLFASVWFSTVLWFFVLLLFVQMESQFPLMWLSSQRTWWLGTQGLTMPVCTSAGPTSPKPENLSLLLLSCMCLVSVYVLNAYYWYLSLLFSKVSLEYEIRNWLD